ncbi:RrF2 family transcriptional regulator [Abyssicoccus albus]|uniref:RrF2 family transcriptional regulator n=1 Tax=Abyssicoccus albus TaxID=1817405 RepID=UPI00097E2571|nr:BadM/Rrf2 family transcriptional regulator [Abyssicoccus albus]
MRLTMYSDYALRTLIFLARNEQDNKQITQISDVAKFYNISKNHLTKIVNHLARTGYIETIRGRGGGIKLKKAPSEINLGTLLRETEESFNLVECFERQNNTCPIIDQCGLQLLLHEGLHAFMKVFDQKTLKDII